MEIKVNQSPLGSEPIPVISTIDPADKAFVDWQEAVEKAVPGGEFLGGGNYGSGPGDVITVADNLCSVYEARHKGDNTSCWVEITPSDQTKYLRAYGIDASGNHVDWTLDLDASGQVTVPDGPKEGVDRAVLDFMKKVGDEPPTTAELTAVAPTPTLNSTPTPTETFMASIPTSTPESVVKQAKTKVILLEVPLT